MNSAVKSPAISGPWINAVSNGSFAGVSDDQYTVRLARSQKEVESALRLRHEVFNIELGSGNTQAEIAGLEFDAFDLKCRHLIVVSNRTGETVGTYRMNSIETAHSIQGFYSANEFTVEDLPNEIFENGIEIGRACIASEHRNTKVLFLLWKALLAYLKHCGKRYYFGCCSIFTRDEEVGARAFRRLVRDGYVDENLNVVPSRSGLSLIDDDQSAEKVDLPALFNMYLRIGARVCGPPMIDSDFGTIDFFVVFDVAAMSEKYRKMFSL